MLIEEETREELLSEYREQGVGWQMKVRRVLSLRLTEKLKIKKMLDSKTQRENFIASL